MTTTGISVSRPRCHPPCHALWCQRRHKGCGSDFCSCWVVPERAAGLLDRGGGGGGVADRPHLGVPAVPALAVQWRGVGSSGCPGRPAAEGATRRSDPFGRVGGNRLMTPPPRPHSHFPTTYLTSATHPHTTSPPPTHTPPPTDPTFPITRTPNPTPLHRGCAGWASPGR
jgi:hypothetical protein